MNSLMKSIFYGKTKSRAAKSNADINMDALEPSDVLELIADEKEAYGDFVRLCERYRIAPNPIATAVSSAKIELLKKLLAGKPKYRRLVNDPNSRS